MYHINDIYDNFKKNTYFGIEIEFCIDKSFKCDNDNRKKTYENIKCKIDDILKEKHINLNNTVESNENIKEYQNTGKWIIENDISLMCNNKYTTIELISPKFSYNSDNFNEIKKILNIFENVGIINNSTGLHVHMSNNLIINNEQFNKFLYLYYTFENIIFLFLDYNRWFNNYVKQGMFESYIQKWYYKKGNRFVVNKFTSLNILNYYTNDPKHFEVRCHHSSLDYTEIINWIEFINILFYKSQTINIEELLKDDLHDRIYINYSDKDETFLLKYNEQNIDYHEIINNFNKLFLIVDNVILRDYYRKKLEQNMNHIKKLVSLDNHLHTTFSKYKNDKKITNIIINYSIYLYNICDKYDENIMMQIIKNNKICNKITNLIKNGKINDDNDIYSQIDNKLIRNVIKETLDEIVEENVYEHYDNSINKYYDYKYNNIYFLIFLIIICIIFILYQNYQKKT